MGGISVITSSVSAPGASAPGSAGPWRPPVWSQPNYAVPSFTLTATNPQNGQQTAYVFDSTARMEHESQQVVTLNPVQTGSSISDNAYVVPPRLTVEILMSDSMQSFTIGQFASLPSRSVSAYQTLLAIQQALTPVSIITRLRPYSNMMIVSLQGHEDERTKFSGRFTVVFQNIITAFVTSNPSTSSGANGNTNSSIQQSTGTTNSGTLQPTPVPTPIQTQNNISNYP